MSILLERRSIRTYTRSAISNEIGRNLLKAAMSAPSAGNEQPWHFIVVKEKQRLSMLAETSPTAKMTAGAALAIIVCGDLTLEKYQGFWMLDCAAATQNLLLSATENGLGSVWVGVYPLEERMDHIRKMFDLPNHIIPFALVPLGYPAETPPPAERYNQSRVHLDSW